MSSKLQFDVCCLSCCGGAIWWLLTKEMQAWCYLQAKMCDPCLSALSVPPWPKKCYINTLPFLSHNAHTDNIHKTVITAAAKSTRRKRAHKPAEVLRQCRDWGIIQRELGEIYQLHQTIGQPDSATYIPRLLLPLLPSLPL